MNERAYRARTVITDAELIALAALVNTQCVEIQAANDQRKAVGASMAYDGFAPTPESEALAQALRERGVLPRLEEKPDAR